MKKIVSIKYVMIVLLVLLVLLVSFRETTYHTIKEGMKGCGYKNSYDCGKNTSCIWRNNGCQYKTCGDYNSKDCSTLSSCIWRDNKCDEKFCSDYNSEKACKARQKTNKCFWMKDHNKCGVHR